MYSHKRKVHTFNYKVNVESTDFESKCVHYFVNHDSASTEQTCQAAGSRSKISTLGRDHAVKWKLLMHITCMTSKLRRTGQDKYNIKC